MGVASLARPGTPPRFDARDQTDWSRHRKRRGMANRLRALQSSAAVGTSRTWHARVCSLTSATAPRAPPQGSSRGFTAHGGEVPSDGHLRRNIAQRRRRAACEEQETGYCDAAERRHRAPRGGRGQHQLEGRDRVSQTLLNRPEGTVAPVDGDEHALATRAPTAMRSHLSRWRVSAHHHKYAIASRNPTAIALWAARNARAGDDRPGFARSRQAGDDGRRPARHPVGGAQVFSRCAQPR